MIKTDTPLLSKIHRYIPVGLTLAVGIGLSIAATVTAGKWANNQTRLQLQQQTDNLTTTFQRKIDEYYYMVVSLSALNFCLSDPSLPYPERYLALYQSQTKTVEMKPDRSSCRNHLIYTHPIQVADQQLSLSFWEIPQDSGFGIPPLAEVTLLSGLLLTGTLVMYIVRSLHYTAEIEAEREKSELLLLNILPKPIADRLKQNQQTIADSFTEATVLFADIVGFTQLSQRISATELVKLLNEIFSAFDQLTETYGLEKIKTIGDAYMVVGGLPTPCDNHADAIADMALEMQQQVAQFSAKYGEPFKIRIGINTGPVVAGVIGTKKFIYDLWGDAVNTASRMESHGVPGGIQVSASTYQHLRDKYQFEERGTIQVKGKGEMMTYLLKNRKEEKKDSVE